MIFVIVVLHYVEDSYDRNLLYFSRNRRILIKQSLGYFDDSNKYINFMKYGHYNCLLSSSDPFLYVHYFLQQGIGNCYTFSEHSIEPILVCK